MSTKLKVLLFRLTHPFCKVFSTTDLSNNDGDMSCTIKAYKYKGTVWIYDVVYADE